MKNALYISRLVLTLLLITALTAAALAGVNAVTAERIAEAKAEKTRQAIQKVLDGATDFAQVEFTDDTDLVKTVYASASGYAVEVAPSGFGGTVTMMVGIGSDGKVLGVQIISHTETPGLGAIAGAATSAGEKFRDSFVGLSGSVSVSKDGGDADTISGATITSRAIADGVNAALACVSKLG